MIVLDKIETSEFKTKIMVKMLSAVGAKKKSLVVLDENDLKVRESLSNIPGVKVALYNTINVYDILNCDSFIVAKGAAEKIRGGVRIMKFVEDIIIRPLITEKSMDMISQKKYSFEVAKDATKPEIAKAVEKMFEGTKVASVNTVNMKAKTKRVRYVEGKTASWKKAIVTLTEDSATIEFFEGMN